MLGFTRAAERIEVRRLPSPSLADWLQTRLIEFRVVHRDGQVLIDWEFRVVSAWKWRHEVREHAQEALADRGALGPAIVANRASIVVVRSAPLFGFSAVAGRAAMAAVFVAAGWLGGSSHETPAPIETVRVVAEKNPADVRFWSDEKLKEFVLSGGIHEPYSMRVIFERAAALDLQEAIPLALSWRGKDGKFDGQRGAIDAAASFLAKYTQQQIEAAVEEFSGGERAADAKREEMERKSKR